MVFLFGDSSPFPLDFDFLATLEKFMACATKVVMLEAESAKQSAAAIEHARERAEASEAVELVHERVMKSLEGALSTPNAGPRGTLTIDRAETHPASIAYAKKIRDFASRLVDEQRANEKQQNDVEAQQAKGDREQRAKDIRGELEKFFRTAQMEMLSARVSFSLHESRNDTNAVIRTPGGIVLGFSLGSAKVPAWLTPRKVSDFMSGLDLMVGVKKSFFKGVVSAEPMHLDDYVISRADLNAEVLLLSLRKKFDQKDSLVFKVRRVEGRLAGEFERPDDPNAKEISSALGPEDLDKLEKLWRAIRASFEQLLPHKESLTHLEIDGKDAIKDRLGMQIIARLVSTFAPIVTEITRKSPNQEELSLKIENPDGRREEIYLKKEQLTKNLEPLPAAGREVFAPLGLDTWVPAISMRPPNVKSAS